MDIFTTALTRVVPVPIKPTDLKVKALVKDTASGKLKEDLYHAENHERYFEKPEGGKKQQGNNSQEQEQEQRQEIVCVETDDVAESLNILHKRELLNPHTSQQNESRKNDEKHPHLDIFV